MKKNGEMAVRRPDDMHLHVRQGELMKVVVPQTAAVFKRAIIMPNILPPVTSAERLERYRERVVAAAGSASGFEPLMTFKIIPGLSPDVVQELKQAGALAGKLYPEGATTNSEDGVSDVQTIYPVLEEMQRNDIVLSIHGEDPDVFSLDREEAFLPTLRQFSRDFPDLRIVLEHLSSAAAVQAVAELPNVWGTITLHHLELTLDDLLGGELQPHYFCKPIVKRPSDRAAIQRAALSGSPKYFFGSDSAPHPVDRKHAPTARAGIFSAPVAYQGLLRFFGEHDALERIEGFTAVYGADFYGVPKNGDELVVRRQDWTAPDEVGGLVPYHAGEVFPYTVIPGWK
ncbi:dihydroorotase [Spirochaeta africana]|uniref:Dihydroorotase n=1 Tax=Spirochaeta africana (strain ATCC 700263 / DSM 8902 / Z-7692) TaxID=889378 RepID=H9UMP0_SPIAZ|nr:dihydroorotase [Spirochaeta africana]AFG38783.1 dihydroorotase, homodimeric type [Spirochaeta africana DSM 8902]